MDDQDLPDQIVGTVRRLTGLLAEKKYSEIVAWTNGRRYPEEEIEIAITDYGRTVAVPPESFFSKRINAIRVDNTLPQKWSVDFPLWTVEEGESDLSVEFTCTEDDRSYCADIELDGIHVL